MLPISIDPVQLNLEEKYLCLDFSNTMDWRKSEHPEDRLGSYGDLLDWANEVGLLKAEASKQMRIQAEDYAEQADAALANAKELREAIYSVIASAVHELPTPEKDLETLNLYIAGAMAGLSLVPRGKGFAWEWRENSESLNWLLWPIARSAADLLTSDHLRRVGECANEDGCGWLFFDTSRNHSRRWCSMESCGNRAKASRFYYRQSPARKSSA